VRFRLLTYNIMHGGFGRLEAIAGIIKSCQPDLVLLQEASDPENVERIAGLAGLPEWQSFARQSPRRLRPFVWLSGGRIRWRTIQTVLDAGYLDGFRATNPKDIGNTLPSGDPHIRLDFMFLPKRDAGRLLTCEVVKHPDAPTASDHLPVFAELAIE
jgi:endonuclease/exonuclease/phosphatase family metal-dependent hydrolase